MNVGKAFKVFILLMVLVSLVPPVSAEDEVTILWSTTIASGITSLEYIDSTSEIVIGTAGNQVLLLDSDGNTEWTTTLSATYPFDTVNATIAADSSNYIWAYSNHTAYLLSRSTGAVQWSVTNTTDSEMIVVASAAKSAGYYAYATPSTLYMFNSTGGMIGGYKPNSNTRWTCFNWTDIEMDPSGMYVYAVSNNMTVSTELYKFYSWSNTWQTAPEFYDYNFLSRSYSSLDAINYEVVVNATNQSMFDQASDDYTKLEVSIGGTQVPFWVETWDTANHVITAWVREFTHTHLSDQTVKLRVNTSRTTNLSNENTTFHFFDDFKASTLNTSKFYYNGEGTQSIAGWSAGGPGYLSIGSTVAGRYAQAHALYNFTPSQNVSVTFRNISITDSAGDDRIYPAVFNGTWAGFEMPTGNYVYSSPGIYSIGSWVYSMVSAGNGGTTQTSTKWGGARVSTVAGIAENFTFEINSSSVTGVHWNVTGTYPKTHTTQIFSETALHPVLQGGEGSSSDGGFYDMIMIRNYTVDGPRIVNPQPSSLTIVSATYQTDNFERYNYTTRKNLGPMGNAKMGMDPSGVWLVISNATYETKQAVSSGAFTTSYTYNSSSGNPTAHPNIAQTGSFSIEGRGSGIFDIVRLDGTRVGTYTAGGTAKSVAISHQGLYAIGGSADGVDYIFSKASTSSWTSLYSSDPSSVVAAVDMSSDGTYAVSGREDGTVTLYHIGEATTAYFTFVVSKSGAPYVGATITIEDGGTTGLSYVPFTSGTLDSSGSYSPKLDYGKYYRITIGSSEKVDIVYTSSNQLVYYYTVGGPTPYQTGLDYQISFNATTNKIWLYYANGSAVDDTVVWTIYRIVDNTLVATITNNTANPPPVFYDWTVPAIWRNTSYRINMNAVHEGHTIQHTQIAYVTNTTATGYGILPPGMDSYVKIAIGFFLLLVIGGIFSFITGPEGAFVVCIAALGLRLFDVLPVDWTPTIMLCLLFAFIGILGRKGPER